MYQCEKCGTRDIFTLEEGCKVGVYCCKCGKLLKYVDNDKEKEMALKQEYARVWNRDDFFSEEWKMLPRSNILYRKLKGE